MNSYYNCNNNLDLFLRDWISNNCKKLWINVNKIIKNWTNKRQKLSQFQNNNHLKTAVFVAMILIAVNKIVVYHADILTIANAFDNGY